MTVANHSHIPPSVQVDAWLELLTAIAVIGGTALGAVALAALFTVVWPRGAQAVIDFGLRLIGSDR